MGREGEYATDYAEKKRGRARFAGYLTVRADVPGQVGSPVHYLLVPRVRWVARAAGIPWKPLLGGSIPLPSGEVPAGVEGDHQRGPSLVVGERK